MESPDTQTAYPAKSATFRLRFPYGYARTAEWRHREHDIRVLLSDPGSFLTTGLLEARELDATCERAARHRIDELRQESDRKHPRLLPEGQEGFDVLWSILCEGRYEPRLRDQPAAVRPTDSAGRELADGLYEFPGGIRDLLNTDYYRRRATLHEPYPHKATIQNPAPRPYRSTLKEPGRKQAFAPRTRKKNATPYGIALDNLRTKGPILLEGDLINGRFPLDYEEVADALGLNSMRLHKLKAKLEKDESIEFPPADQQRELVVLLKWMQDPGPPKLTADQQRKLDALLKRIQIPGPPQLKLTLLYSQEDGGAMYLAELPDLDSPNDERPPDATASPKRPENPPLR